MRRDHRPYWLKNAHLRLQKLYTRHFIKPQLDQLGRDYFFIKPWYVEIFGRPVKMGAFSNVIATADARVRLSVWTDDSETEGITIGDACLLCPGARISAACGISVGHNCMLASRCYLTDADWHGLYDRTRPIGNRRPVRLEDNVWVGDSAIICKGVTVGANSIVGAGAVVADDVPANCVAAGNPARIVKKLDPNREIKTRREWFAQPQALYRAFDTMDRRQLAGNSLLGWLRATALRNSDD